MKTIRRAAKTDATRKRIMEAARRVFTRYPYDAAGLRIMGREGGFNHSFIRYHFRSKENLFEAVSKDLIAQYASAADGLLQGLDGPLFRNTEILVDRFVEFAFDHPDAFYVMMLNLGAVDHVSGAFPGMRFLRTFHEDTLALFSASDFFTAPQEDVNRVFFCSSVMLANCVGAARFFGKILDMDPRGTAYRRWVKDLFVFLLYPVIKKLVFAENVPGPTGKRTPAAGNGGLCPVTGASTDVARLPAQSQPSQGDDQPEPGGGTRGEISRRRIIAVARRIFSRYPYNATSIRMIGAEGGFDFTLIYHYFPTKAELFEAVVSQLLDEHMATVRSIMTEPGRGRLRDNTRNIITRLMDYCFSHPDVMKGAMQNIAQVDRFEDLPGFDILTRFLVDSLALFREFMPLSEEDEQTRMWLYGFGIVIFNCVGAASYHARVMGMTAGSRDYRRWVKDTLRYMFYPSLKALLFSGGPTVEKTEK